jgi:hypothetical protein
MGVCFNELLLVCYVVFYRYTVCVQYNNIFFHDV